MPILKIKYKKYPNLLKSIKNRHEMYNETLDFIEEERKLNNAFIIRPKSTVQIGRLEKDKTKLKSLYDQGYNDAKDCFDDLLRFLNS